MEQLRDHADDRLLHGCVYCQNGPEETRDHVPSRVLLDQPYPANLPVVPACHRCNNSFSRDEEYLACLVECAQTGQTNPDDVTRENVAEILKRSPGLRSRIEQARFGKNALTTFRAEDERVNNVVLKLARGHAAFELSRPFLDPPEHLVWWPISLMTDEQRDAYNAPYQIELIDEVGSRSLQRAVVAEVHLRSSEGEGLKLGFLTNDWLDVQEGRYRYHTIADGGVVRIKFVLSEFLACEVVWNDS